MTELLTVIAIIGILAALLFPVLGKVREKAKVAKAKTAVAGLEIAFKAYYTEYGRWPIKLDASALANSNYTYAVDTNFVALLQGANNTGSVTGGSGYPPPPFTPVATSTLQGNPRQIRFSDFKQADLDAANNYVDPWSRPYYCRFDVSYWNAVEDPFTGGIIPPKAVQAGFVIWSAGPDAKYDNRDAATGPSPLNKDNIKSW